MSNIPLASIEWHDLPASELRISETGISLLVTPYNETTDSYDARVLRITDAELLNVKVIGVLSAKDLSSMEVSSFIYSVSSPGRITGTLGPLPGQAGFWELSFTDAHWELAEA